MHERTGGRRCDGLPAATVAPDRLRTARKYSPSASRASFHRTIESLCSCGPSLLLLLTPDRVPFPAPACVLPDRTGGSPQLPMPSAPNSTDLAQLAADVYHASEALSATAQDVPRPVSELLQDFDALQRALEQNHTLTQWTGRQPPPLGAVHEILRQSLDCIDKQRAVSSQSRPPHARKDSGRTVEGAWSGVNHESIRARLAHSILALRNLNFVTVLIAGFVDFHTSSERTQLHANVADPSRTTPDDRELAVLLEGFARVGYLYHRLSHSRAGQTEHARQLSKAEEQNKNLLQRLLAYTRLQSHPLAAHSIAGLISRCSMEHQGSIISIGSLAARRATDVTSGFGATFTDCLVTIELDGHTPVDAQGFRLADGKTLRWCGADGHVVFEHRLQERSRRHPWRHSLHGPLTVSFTAHDAVGSKLVCHGRHHQDHVDQSPDYVFRDNPSYELFQTVLRDRPFLKEFEVKSIKTKNDEKTENSVIKFWGSREASSATMTIPVTFDDNHIRHQDPQLRWLSWVKVPSSKEVRLDLKQATKRRASSGAHNCMSNPSYCSQQLTDPTPTSQFFKCRARRQKAWSHKPNFLQTLKTRHLDYKHKYCNYNSSSC